MGLACETGNGAAGRTGPLALITFESAMVNYLLPLALAQLMVIQCEAQAQARTELRPCSICSTKAVAYTESHLTTLTEADFTCFMATFDSQCQANVEYSEFSNEVLFKVLLTHPRFVIRYMEQDLDSTKNRYVLTQLTAPVSDEVQPDACIRAISDAPGSISAKERVLMALKRIPQ